MNATHLLTMQMTSLFAMLLTAETLLASRTATLIFATALFIFARCSIYISKNSKRLLKELNREKITEQR